MNQKIVAYHDKYLEQIQLLDKECFISYWKYNRKTISKLKSINNLNLILISEFKVMGFIWSVEKEGYSLITRMCISPNYRGKGFGSLLLIKFLNDYSGNSIQLTVRQNNKIARTLYENHGFTIIRTFKNYYKKSTGSNRIGLRMRYLKNESSC